MDKPRRALLALALLALPSVAGAQDYVASPWAQPPTWGAPAPPPPAAVAPVEGPRFRFGIAGNLTVGLVDARAQHVSTGVFAPGLTLDLGVQINRSLAVYARGSVATIFVLNQASLYGVVEYTYDDHFSFGTGIGWDGMSNLFSGDAVAVAPRDPSFVPTRSRWSALSFPAIVGFNFGRRNEATGRLRAFRLGLEGALGVEPSSGAVGWHAALTVGYVSM